ncbi:MAG: DUF4175 family protein [Cryomorphaceae bacterium]|nr:DUF4175 family protein [Cryomorphaceae bacterium]
MADALREIRSRIDDYLKRIYRLRMLEGIVFVLISTLVGFLLLSTFEYIAWSSSGVRTTLWISFSLIILSIIIWRVIIPLLQSMNLVKRMSRRQAANLLSAKLPELRDQLINVLDLGEHAVDSSLLLAAIEQKSQEISKLSFHRAIRKDQLFKFLKINGAVVAIWALLLFFDIGRGLLESGNRLVNFRTEYEKPAPFSWNWENDDVEVKHNDPVTLRFSARGDVFPESGQITINQQSFPLRKVNDYFEFEVPRVKDKIHFSVSGSGVSSKTFELLPKFYPGLTGLQLRIIPPKYTGLDPQTSQSGNITVPQGSKVEWRIKTKHTDELIFVYNALKDSVKSAANVFEISTKIQSPGNLTLSLHNSDQNLSISQDYAIQVITDRNPTIDINWLFDEKEPDVLSVFGSLNDDYGLRKWEIQINTGNGFKRFQSHKLNNQRQAAIRAILDLKDKSIPEGKDIQFRIAATDNDALQGGKTTYSSAFSTRKLTKEEREEKRKEKLSKSGSSIQQFSEEQQKISRETQDILDKRMAGERIQFKDEEQLKDLMEKQKESLDKTIESLEELQKELENSDDPTDQEKAERVEEQKEDLKNLRDEIQDLLDKNKPEELLKKAEDIQKKMEERQRELKTNQAQMEKMEKLRDLLQKIDEMRQMSEETKKMEENDDDGLQDMKDRLEKWEKDTEKSLDDFPEMKDLLKEKDFDKQKEDLKQDLKDAKDQKDSQKKKDKKDDAGRKMDKMQEDMMNAFMEMQQSASQENMEDLRQLLRNVVLLSFEQEWISDKSGGILAESGLLSEMVERQQKMQTASAHILDSLYALAARVPEIESKVRKEAVRMVERMQLAQDDIRKDEMRKFGGNMKASMEHSNELALLLDQILQQMMMDMSDGMEGDQNCNKPGKGKPSLSDLLGEQQKMGEEPGGDDGGDDPKGEDGDGGDGADGKSSGEGDDKEGEGGEDGKESAEAARRLQMMMRQEEIRRQLQEILKDKGMEGEGKDVLDMMEEQERDIILGAAQRKVMMRQKEIEIRLLELEKAIREQEQDDQREAETADDIAMPGNQREEYIRKKLEEIEKLQRSPFRFKPYYEERRQKFLEYTQ